MAQYFGTDGIRGRAGEGKLSEDSLEKLAHAIGAHFGAGATAVIGRDTRESGDWVKRALTRGLTRQGVNVTSVGISPTPATASMVPHLDADFGLMITASHNPYHDNGVKLFGPDGRKISDVAQDAIEGLIATAISDGLDAAKSPGVERTEQDKSEVYVEALSTAFRSTGQSSLSGLRVVADCANGAAFKTFPAVLRALGADPVLIGIAPNGQNINAACGSTHPEALAKAVRDAGADIGVALDGDADRLIMVDNNGAVVDGDQLIARIATDWQAQTLLRGDAVVSTVMSNLGLERYLEAKGLRLERTAVGDRHVAARMIALDSNLGGEPSGHLLMTDYGVTGDGSLAALMILAGLLASGQSSADYLRVFEPFPQILKNVRFSGASPLLQERIQQAIQDADKRLGQSGRVLVRASGTEPLIRVMAEGEDTQLVSGAVEELCALIEQAAE
ncbi:MAG: phosphoglucosamine mutase [Litorimonas sp.]